MSETAKPGFSAFPRSLIVLMLSPGGAAEERLLLLVRFEHRVNFVRALRLIPVGIAFVIRAFVEVSRSVTVENGPTKGFSSDRIPVAAAGAVPTSEHKLEITGSRLAENRNRTRAESRFATVVSDLTNHRLAIFLAVEIEENFAHHLVLIFVQKAADTGFGDVPIVAHLVAKRIIETEAKLLALLIVQAVVERFDDRFGLGRFLFRSKKSGRSERSGGGCRSTKKIAAGFGHEINV